MAPPTPTKTWSTSVTRVPYATSVAETNKSFILAFKNILKTVGWSVSGSGNGTTGAMDSVDRWSTTANLVFSTGSRSWIVLKNTAMGAGNFQMLIDYHSANSYQYDIYVSPGGNYTGGGTSKPTATDELSLYTDTTFGCTSSQTYNRNITAVYSSDLKCTRLICTWNNSIAWVMLIDTPSSAKSWWTNPWYVYLVASGNTSATLISAANVNMNVAASGKILSSFSCLHVGTTPACDYSHFSVVDNAGYFHLFPVGIISNDTTRRGRLGEVFDMWMAPSGTPNGLIVSSSSKKIICVGQMAIGWNGNDSLIIENQ